MDPDPDLDPGVDPEVRAGASKISPHFLTPFDGGDLRPHKTTPSDGGTYAPKKLKNVIFDKK